MFGSEVGGGAQVASPPPTAFEGIHQSYLNDVVQRPLTPKTSERRPFHDPWKLELIITTLPKTLRFFGKQEPYLGRRKNREPYLGR